MVPPVMRRVLSCVSTMTIPTPLRPSWLYCASTYTTTLLFRGTPTYHRSGGNRSKSARINRVMCASCGVHRVVSGGAVWLPGRRTGSVPARETSGWIAARPTPPQAACKIHPSFPRWPPRLAFGGRNVSVLQMA